MSERVFAPAWEACADRSAYVYRVRPTVHTKAMLATSPGYPTASTQFWTYGNTGILETPIAFGGYLDIPGCTVGDLIQVSAFAMFARSGNLTKAVSMYVDAIDRVNGTAGTQTHVPGAVWSTSTGLASGQDAIPLPIAMTGMWTVVLAGTTRITLALEAPTLSGLDTAILWEANISAIRFPVL
jgi:hypothetical protein